MRVGTVDRVLWPLYDLPSLKLSRCAVCGRTWPLNQHHVIRRSDGQVYEDGKKLRKPTITLCGSGNTSGCHGKAHGHRLHFRNHEGRWQYLETDEPLAEWKAVDMEGWSDVEEDAFSAFEGC